MYLLLTVIFIISILICILWPNIPYTRRIRLKIAMVSDRDIEIAPGKSACSEFLEGILIWQPKTNIFSVNFKNSPRELCSKILAGNRGMELSDLITFHGKLLAVDDKTGIIYQICRKKLTVSIWATLTDGDGSSSAPFKGEWFAIKNGKLYVGGYGKYYTDSTGAILHSNPMWIKIVNRHGHVSHVNWRNQYLALASRLSIQHPGFVIHESAAWSEVHQKWFFLPRAVSREPYGSGAENISGENYLLIADDGFNQIDVVLVGSACPTRGFSAFRFLPKSEDRIIMALKTEEREDSLASYFLIFDLAGHVLHEETKFADSKYEGLEFLL